MVSLNNIELVVCCCSLMQLILITKQSFSCVESYMAGFLGEVFILKTTNRAKGVPILLSKLGLNDFSGKQVALKANFNSADSFPASTHLETHYEQLLKP
jgi:hypothetical protein